MNTGQIQNDSKTIRRPSQAHWAGLIAIVLALLAAPFSLLVAALVLLLFVVLCFTAPFLPAFGFYLPIISRGQADRQAVALTFDDCPHPDSTIDLLDLLKKYQVRATFYVNGIRAEQHPELIRKIISDGHAIGNHSYSHDNFIMFKSSKTLKEEITKTQQILRKQGVVPMTFRPPVGVTAPRLAAVMDELDMVTVNFSRRAGDRGNIQIQNLSGKILKGLKPGDIIMLHDIPPRNHLSKSDWLFEIEQILVGINSKGLKVISLEVLVDRPIMKTCEIEADTLL